MLKEKNIIIENLNISFLDNEKEKSKVILFLHGWAADKYNLSSIYNYLLNSYRIITIDLPGFGQSDRPKETVGTYEYSEIIYKFMTNLDIKKVSIVGHSFGGKIALLLSYNYPELIERLILIDSSGIKPKRGLLWYLKVFSFKFLKFLTTKGESWLQGQVERKRRLKRIFNQALPIFKPHSTIQLLR